MNSIANLLKIQIPVVTDGSGDGAGDDLLGGILGIVGGLFG